MLQHRHKKKPMSHVFAITFVYIMKYINRPNSQDLSKVENNLPNPLPPVNTSGDTTTRHAK